MAKRTDTSKYTLYLLIFVVVIILAIGLLSATGSDIDAQQQTPTKQVTQTQGKQTDDAVATVSFMILPHDTEGGGE